MRNMTINALRWQKGIEAQYSDKKKEIKRIAQSNCDEIKINRPIIGSSNLRSIATLPYKGRLI